MSLRPSERTEVRRNRYKVAVDADDGHRRREDNMIEIRKSKREESLQKKRREGMPSQNSILSLQSYVIEKRLETLPAMLAGVYTDDNNMQLEATTQFRKLLSIERSPPIEEVIQAGVVPRLVEFLMRSDFPQLQFEAAWALTNIASGTSENTKVVIDHGAVPIFVQLLQAMSDDVREQTRSSLPALERLIHSSDEEVLTNACWELSYLSDGTNDKIQAVIESGVCNRLVELLMYPSPSVLIPALSTVGNIVTGDDTQTRSVAETSVLSPEGPSASDDEIRELEVSRAQNNKKRLSPEGPSASDDEIRELEVSRAQNNKKRLRKDSDAGKKRGVCYLSRIPPHMDPTRLRQILSQYGDIHRIYLVPENPTVQVQLKQAGGFRGKQFSEGWVEFTRRSVAKKVANMLNGEQIGGKRRSSFYYDIWNIKYLNKFKWDDLTTETANNNRTREQKLTMEISAAKRERDFYLKKVDQSKALKFMKERMNKKQKTRGGELSGESEHVEEAKVIRRFPQNRPVADRAVQSKSGLSKDILKEVFGSS